MCRDSLIDALYNRGEPGKYPWMAPTLGKLPDLRGDAPPIDPLRLI